MAQNRKKRQRSGIDDLEGENKKISLAKTPEKTKTVSDLSTSMENKDNMDELSSNAECTEGEKEPSLKEVLCAIQELHHKFDKHSIDIKKDIETIDERLTIVEDTVEHCTTDISLMNQENSSFKDELRILKDIAAKQQSEIKSLQAHTLDLQARSMRCNLLFHNIPEQTNENCEHTVHKELKGLGFAQEIQVERAHRLGQPRPKYPRPIVAKFAERYCELILNKSPKKRPGDPGTRITRQSPQEYREKRSKLWEMAETFKKIDSTCKTQITADGRLFVNGQLHRDKFVKPNIRTILELTETEKDDIATKCKLHAGRTIYEGGSSFVAMATRVKNTEEARKAYQAFLLKPGSLAARHNVGVYRVYTPENAKTEEDWYDDEEHGSGRVLKNLLHKMNLTNIALFLSRGTDGTHLGTRRFRVMEEAAESALQSFSAGHQS